MSYLEKLLDGVEVAWLPLEEVAKIKHGKDWKKLGDGDIPVYGSGGVMGYVDTYAHDKPSVLIPRKGSITNVFYVESPFWNIDTIYYTEINTSMVVPKYLYHFILTVDLMALDTGSGRPSLTQAILNNLQIPIPPLQVQQEIVDILDKFTKLEAELEAELEARKKQYYYYRDELLSFDGVEFEELHKVFFTKNGYTPAKSNKSYWTNGSIPWFRMDDIRKNGKILSESLQLISEDAIKGGRLFPANSIIIATSATIGEHALITVPHLSNQRFTSLSPKPEFLERLNMKFVFYYCFVLDNWCLNNTTISSFASVNMTEFKKFKIPIPPLKEQARIVNILDKFDALVNDISSGLPAEITARRQQYEHYRDLLLNFPKPEVAA